MSLRPKICGNCGKLMGIEPVCPYCGTPRNDVRQLKGFIKGLSVGGNLTVTNFILSFNVFMYLGPILAFLFLTGDLGALSQLYSGPAYQSLFGVSVFSGPFLREGYWWGLFTANFLHLNLLHILFNSYALWILAPSLEEDLSPTDFFVFYILAGVGGFAISALAGNLSGGASSALFGLIAAHIFLPLARGDSYRGPMFQIALQWAVFSFVFGILVGADSYAHGGGFFFGGLLSYVWVLISRNSFWNKIKLPLALALLGCVFYGLTMSLVTRWF